MTTDPFAHGALTDVDGVRVGHAQRTGRGWQSGTTVVFVPDGAVAAVDVRGGGPGTRETDALAPGNLVDRIHAVCLSGGSAYGLAAADGVMRHLESLGLGVAVGTAPHDVVPVVPAAVIFDLGRGGSFTNRPDDTFGERAIRSARASRVRRGAVGAGAGARAGGLQGGVGMASTTVEIPGTDLGEPVCVAALAVVNAAGSVIDPATARPWHAVGALRRPTRDEVRALADGSASPPTRLNTTIGVVVTDAELDRPEVGRLALAAHDGLARAIRPAHSLIDGDTVFGLATGTRPLTADRPDPDRPDTDRPDPDRPDPDRPDAGHSIVRDVESRAVVLNALAAAAADVFATACVDAVITAARVGESPAYHDLCPSAFRDVAAS